MRIPLNKIRSQHIEEKRGIVDENKSLPHPFPLFPLSPNKDFEFF
jgi:hypothetical protein